MRCDSRGFNPSYVGLRGDILDLIPDNVGKVLDFGCSVGRLGEELKHRFRAEVVGIEFDEQMAKAAKGKLDRVILGDIDKINLEDQLVPDYFDCIIFGDILEHLTNPWEVLKKATTFLNKDGTVVASIPNVRHYTVVLNLLFRGYWPYRERGLHDRTHLRFFTLRNIQELFQYANLRIVRLKRNHRIIERQHPHNRLSRYLAFAPFKEFLTFQYLIVAKKGQQESSRFQH